MKRLTLPLFLLLGSSLAFAAGLITKQAAETDALKAVGGGTVQQATLDYELGKRIWSVDITGKTREYEVWVDAHTSATLKIITQAASPNSLVSKTEAEQDALDEVGSGDVLQSALDTFGKNDRKIWSVDIADSEKEYEVLVDAHTGAIVKVTSLPLASMATTPCRFITKAKAESVALAAVHGGTVILGVLDKTDTPVVWSVDIQHTDGQDYEVKVNACTGRVFQIIVGG